MLIKMIINTCSELTKRGIKCKNKVKNNNIYCNIHNKKNINLLNLPNEIIINIFTKMDFISKINFLVTCKRSINIIIDELINIINMEDIIKILNKNKSKRLISYFYYVYRKCLVNAFIGMNINICKGEENFKETIITYIENEIYKITFEFSINGDYVKINISNKNLCTHFYDTFYSHEYWFNAINGSTMCSINNFTIKDIYNLYIFICNYIDKNKKIPNVFDDDVEEENFKKLLYKKFNFLDPKN